MGAAAGGALLNGCKLGTTLVSPPMAPILTARPKSSIPMPPTTGKFTFNDALVDGVMYVPASATTLQQAPLLVFLHGAGRGVDFFIDGVAPAADQAGVIVLAPMALENTWDAIRGVFGHDIVGINAALTWVFNRWPIDPAKIVLSGFSDGASYALGLGRANGSLFARIAAYSPGFIIGVQPQGRPPILISHGTEDPVLPYTNTAEYIVPTLQREGYTVDFRSFQGPHAVKLTIANEVITDLGKPPAT